MSLVLSQMKLHFHVLISISNYWWDEAPFIGLVDNQVSSSIDCLCVTFAHFLLGKFFFPLFLMCDLDMTRNLLSLYALQKESPREQQSILRGFCRLQFAGECKGIFIKSERTGVILILDPSLTYRTESLY